MISTQDSFDVQTAGGSEVRNITDEVAACVARGGLRSGLATVFVVGSTAGITTTEYEPGLARHDLKAAFERLAPEDGVYRHEETWKDDNGHSHVRAALLGPSLAVPVAAGRLTLGQWQQIVLIDFDTRPRQRRVVVQLLGT
ncbi:MAG TPA: secondary thiamine-phosphate synthase enzyme YjbQ [Phycisphaerae bacterium]|jgi:secondary thiamine-phosphate synthase enzyme